MNYNTGNDTYSFGGSTDPGMTIWDAGGDADVISADGSPNKAIINLNESKFSAIVNTNNYDPNTEEFDVAIAIGVTIENAIGTAQDDILIGNHAKNVIQGNAGNDLIFGDELVAKKVIKEGVPILGWNLEGQLGTGASNNPNPDPNNFGIFYKGQYQIDGTTDANDADTLDGWAGNDYIYGGMGDDTISGGVGNNYLDGGPGTDTALYNFAGPSQVIAFKKGGWPLPMLSRMVMVPSIQPFVETRLTFCTQSRK